MYAKTPTCFDASKHHQGFLLLYIANICKMLGTNRFKMATRVSLITWE